MWPFIMMAASTLMSAKSKHDAGEAEKEAGAQDLTDAALSGHFREKGISEKRDRTLGKIRARAGASGVEMAGSALEVLMNSASQAERDLFIARHVTQRASDSARRRMATGERTQSDAYLEGMLKLGSNAVSARKDAAGRYKSQSVGEEDWMSEYGND